MELPLFKATIGSDGIGISAIALVKNPAIEELWQAFSQEDFENQLKFQTTDKEQRKLGGFLLIADRPVFRNDANGKYRLVFERDAIDEAVELFFKNNRHQSVNIGHNPEDTVKDVFLTSSFQIDRGRGINVPTAFDQSIPDGSWFVEYKVNNDTIWNDFVKTGDVRAFSMEGLFKIDKVEMSDNKTLLQKIKDLAQEFVHRGEGDGKRTTTLQDGTVIVYEGDLTTGTPVNMITPEGDEVALVDGTHELAEGDIIIVEDGIVTDIQSKELIDEDMELKEQFEKLQVEFTAFKKGIEDEKLALAASEKENATEKEFAAVRKEMADLKKEVIEVVTEFTKADVTPPAQQPAHATERTPLWKKKLDNVIKKS